jgi:hypothetical protein
LCDGFFYFDLRFTIAMCYNYQNDCGVIMELTQTNHEVNGELVLFPLIEHKEGEVIINQRAVDGYINATAICKACGKKFNDWHRLRVTEDFLKELSSVTGIPATELIQTVQGGTPYLQGAWIHPQVAINLGQWASPKFAVNVAKWVFDWMSGKQTTEYRLPYHLRRYIINRSKIPTTHFSMLDELTLRLVAPLEHYGYELPNSLMPDISMGRMFCSWCRDNGYDPDSFPTYEHIFDDGKRPPVQARLYPNELITKFRDFFNAIWLRKKAVEYFSKKDSGMIPILERIIKELPAPSEIIQIEQS